ncbi:hypothetical protein [Engelhardtia mirabilis]|uniref:Uncharacterized protein n=1 Tax=Engelhardtia mirabilis TaxID=2528011 RepID=A0A518BSW1_9BACT|nr:hypothetical protein Pla133_51830 [Planctomycetes bacterium Pla133]QDV04385.1 hypothetical protein Pla86_51800 [Planctomycetes bacterium Pla86]
MAPKRSQASPTASDPENEPSSSLVERLRVIGEDLGSSLRGVLDGLPGGPHRPGRLAQTLGVNRATASKVLTAASKRDPLEVLHQSPGPEPLRRLAASAHDRGVGVDATSALTAAADAFDLAIREEAGTRPALDALITSELPGARERFELASKYAVFKGLSQLKGVQADLWLGVAVLSPAADDPQRIDLTWLNGAVAMRRMRPGVTVRFAYRHLRDGVPGGGDDMAASEWPGGGVLPLDRFCENPPARLEARRVDDTIQYTLPDDVLGPKRAVDMFVVDHHPAAMSRTAADPERRRNSLFVEPAIPSAALLFDVLVHDEVFPGVDPRLFLFDTGYDGIADVNDRSRDADRVDLAERVEFLGTDLRRFTSPDLPRYGALLEHLADRFGWSAERYRGFRTRIQYPVHGWQVCQSFERPLA